MNNCLFVMIGGAVGALLRYGVSRAFASVTTITLPLGTFVVNIIGCFVLGVLHSFASRNTSLPPGVTLMLTVGMCGSFTTFSTFSAETIRMLNDGHTLHAILYVAASVVIGFFLFWVGSKIG